jgi:hypothetical protein
MGSVRSDIVAGDLEIGLFPILKQTQGEVEN